jgi:hypothetical protein
VNVDLALKGIGKSLDAAVCFIFRVMSNGNSKLPVNYEALIAKAHASVRGIVDPAERDLAFNAILASLMPWSNGPVEGQVHRLKLIKRQMYGRASFDLLTLRVLQRA